MAPIARMDPPSSVHSRLSLYLNFINLFMLLLQLLGNRNNN